MTMRVPQTYRPNIVSIPLASECPNGFHPLRVYNDTPGISLGQREVAEVPEGPVVIGSRKTAHWGHVPRFFSGTTSETEEQLHVHLEVREKRQGGDHIVTDSRWLHPAVHVSWYDAKNYLEKLNKILEHEGTEWRLALLTGVQWEKAARGPEINGRDWMEANGITIDDFFDKLRGCGENIVTEMKMGARIFTDPKGADREDLTRIIQGNEQFWFWRVHGTPTGRLTPDEAWYDQPRRGSLINTALATFGERYGYGVYPMNGNVWNWCENKYDNKEHEIYQARFLKSLYLRMKHKLTAMGILREKESMKDTAMEGSMEIRGGSWLDNIDIFLAIVHSNMYDDGYVKPDYRGFNLGMRIAAIPQD